MISPSASFVIALVAKHPPLDLLHSLEALISLPFLRFNFLLAFQVLRKEQVWVTPVLEHSHDAVVHVAVVLVFVLFLSPEEHVSHGIVHLILP